jgi:tripartite-type tricarboxylate transporter receptor subunit TctC
MRPSILAKTICAVLPLAALHLPAQAQADWPNKSVRIIVSFAPGGSSDVVGRQLAQHLGSVFGQQFIVENRAGAAGNIGTDAVAKAAPDGYTLGNSTSGPLANNKLLYKNMPYDPQKDLTAIALVGEIPLVITAHPSVKARNLKEFVALGKATPGGFTVGHPGTGTIGHLAMEAFKTLSGANLQMVPYKGDVPAMTDLMGGQVQLVGAPITSFIANIQSEKIRALAVTSKTRFPGLPNVPTAIEQGIDLEATVWNAMVGPAGLPRAIVTKLNAEVNRYTNSPEGRAKLSQFALVPANTSPEGLSTLMANEPAKWKPVVDAGKISLE